MGNISYFLIQKCGKSQKLRLCSHDRLCGCTLTLLGCFAFYESLLYSYFPLQKPPYSFFCCVYLFCSERTLSNLTKVDAWGGLYWGDERWKRRKSTTPMQAHTNGEAHTHVSIRTHTFLKLQKGVKIRKREGERGDCSTKEARERASQWRHDNE